MSALQTLRLPELIQPAKSGRMYPICIGLEFRTLDASRARIKGRGHTVFLSSSSVVFESEAGLPSGLPIELAINWPVKLEERVELRLCIRGRTANNAGNYTTVRIDRHEFRTRAREVRR